MKGYKTVSGKITHLVARNTRYGRRAEAKVEHIDHSTGEVTEHNVLAWGEEAIALENEGLGNDVGVAGYWKKDDAGKPFQLGVRQVSQLRHIDPRTLDLSRYL
jgi:hypothetical protein